MPKCISPLDAVRSNLLFQINFRQIIFHFPFFCALCTPSLPLSYHIKVQCYPQRIILLPLTHAQTIAVHLPLLSFPIGAVKPSIAINSLIFLLFINFTPHMALNIALSVLLKIATFIIQQPCFTFT